MNRLLIIIYLIVAIVTTTAEYLAGRQVQRIVGGEPAPEGRWPFFGHYTGDSLCGSTLIYEDILIGAAHCGPPSDCGLVLDSINFGNGTFATVEKYVMHPQFDNFLSNDIIAMKVDGSPRSADGSLITPVPYNTNFSIPFDDQELTTIGYGVTEDGFLSEDLMQVNVNYLPYDDCAPYFLPECLVESTMFCAAAPGRDSCGGDSGGPIFSAEEETGDPLAVGIVSWGFQCAGVDPGVYTRISNYEAWIEEAICCLSDNPPVNCTCTFGVGFVEKCGNVTDSEYEHCLSPDTTTMVESKGKVLIKDVVVGDKVMTASGKYKNVFTISHSHPNRSTTFVRVQTDMNDENPLELTPLHLLFLQGNENPVPAKDIRIGDFVQTLHGPREVIDITHVTRNGFYNPVTTDGTIVVDGVIASTYTSLNGGSHLEIAGIQLISFQSLLDIAISPFHAFCEIAVSLDLCNQLLETQNERPRVVNSLMRFYKFWSRQHNTQQFIILFAFIFLFGFARIMLNPTVLLVMSCFIGILGCRYLSANMGIMKVKNAQAQDKFKSI